MEKVLSILDGRVGSNPHTETECLVVFPKFMGRECVGRMFSATYTDQSRKNVCGLGKLNKATLISASSGANF